MYLGEIVDIGTRSAVFENPQHPYARRLLSAVPITDPSRRSEKPRVEATDLQSPVREIGYIAEKRRHVEVGPDHTVQLGSYG